MKLTDEQIKEIAEEVDCGLRCFYNLKTGKILSCPDFDGQWYGDDTELWQDTLDELENNSENYFEFEGMQSYESYEVMADFAETVDDEELQEKLFRALNNRKPFQNFKWEVDNSGEYRQKWFDFKNAKMIEFVKKQIERYNM